MSCIRERRCKVCVNLIADYDGCYYCLKCKPNGHNCEITCPIYRKMKYKDCKEVNKDVVNNGECLNCELYKVAIKDMQAKYDKVLKTIEHNNRYISDLEEQINTLNDLYMQAKGVNESNSAILTSLQSKDSLSRDDRMDNIDHVELTKSDMNAIKLMEEKLNEMEMNAAKLEKIKEPIQPIPLKKGIISGKSMVIPPKKGSKRIPVILKKKLPI